MTDSIAYYAQLTDDPASSVWLSVITSDGALGETLAVEYGHDAGDLNFTKGLPGQKIPERDEWIYQGKLAGLKPGRLVFWQTALHSDPVPLKTLPNTLSETLRLMVMSDIHIENGDAHMNSPEEMEPAAAEKPDAVLFAGDLVESFSESYGETRGGFWIQLFRDYLNQLHHDFIPPMTNVPGNHDVGNHSWEGSDGESIDPDGTYFRVFWKAISEIDPQGVNYAAIPLGDYAMALGIDTHSEYPSQTGQWVGSVDTSAPCVIPFHHSPLVADDIRRSPEDQNLQQRLRNALFRFYRESRSIQFSIAGHIHVRTRTVPLEITETDPQTDEAFVLSDANGDPDGWVVQGSEGHQEIGQGYTDNRNGGNEGAWFLETSTLGEKHYNIVEISRGSVVVKTTLMTGQIPSESAWKTPFPPRQPSIRRGSVSTPVRRLNQAWEGANVRRISGGEWL